LLWTAEHDQGSTEKTQSRIPSSNLSQTDRQTGPDLAKTDFNGPDQLRNGLFN